MAAPSYADYARDTALKNLTSGSSFAPSPDAASRLSGGPQGPLVSQALQQYAPLVNTVGYAAGQLGGVPQGGDIIQTPMAIPGQAQQAQQAQPIAQQAQQEQPEALQSPHEILQQYFQDQQPRVQEVRNINPTPIGNDLGLEMLYALSGMAKKPGTQAAMKQILDFHRQQQAGQQIAVAMDNAQQAVNQHNYPKARQIYQDAMRAAALSSPEMLKVLVPQMQNIQNQEQQFLGNMAILNNEVSRINNEIKLFDIPEDATPAQRRELLAKNTFLQNMKTQRIMQSMNYMTARGIDPAVMAGLVQKMNYELRPAPELPGTMIINPLTGETMVQKIERPLGLEGISKEQEVALGSLYGMNKTQFMNMYNSNDPAQQRIAQGIAQNINEKAGIAAIKQQVGPTAGAQLGAAGATEQEWLYGQKQFAPGGQLVAPPGGQAPAPQGRPQGAQGAPGQVPPGKPQGQGQVQTYPAPSSSYLPPVIAKTPQGQMATSGMDPGTYLGAPAAAQEEAQIRVQQQMPKGDIVKVDMDTMQLVNPLQVPQNHPQYPTVTKDVGEKIAKGNVVSKMATDFLKTYHAVAEQAGGYEGPFNKLERHVNNYFPGLVGRMQDLKNARTTLWNEYQQFAGITGQSDRDIAAVRQSMDGLAAGTESIESVVGTIRRHVFTAQDSQIPKPPGTPQREPATPLPVETKQQQQRPGMAPGAKPRVPSPDKARPAPNPSDFTPGVFK